MLLVQHKPQSPPPATNPDNHPLIMSEKPNMKQKIKTQFRQGDVMIEKVDSIPSASIKENGRVILAHGEVTGHAHEIDQSEGEAWRSGEALFVKTKKKTAVTHQEHNPIPLDRGSYKVTRQEEYSPEEIINVAD